MRYECKACDDHPTTTEKYNWCSKHAKITKAFEEYLMRCLINSTVEDVSRKESVSYKTIVRAVSRQVNSTVDWSQYTDLNTIGIDEISLFVYGWIGLFNSSSVSAISTNFPLNITAIRLHIYRATARS